MNITTKFGMSDKVFFMHANKVREGKIDLVKTESKIESAKTVNTIIYHIENIGWVKEKDCYATKEDLVATL